MNNALILFLVAVLVLGSIFLISYFKKKKGDDRNDNKEMNNDVKYNFTKDKSISLSSNITLYGFDNINTTDECVKKCEDQKIPCLAGSWLNTNNCVLALSSRNDDKDTTDCKYIELKDQKGAMLFSRKDCKL